MNKRQAKKKLTHKANKIGFRFYKRVARKRDNESKYEAKVITRGNCMICGKELTEGLFLCKECAEKDSKVEREDK